jgi:predicted O-methyltransferase YrrM
MVTLRDLLERRFLLHDQGSTTYNISDQVLEFIADNIGTDSKTLETGAGLTTIVFAMKGAEHVCITPAQDEVDNITKSCKQLGVSLDRVAFHINFSERVVPFLEYPLLDLVLIDGGHGMPTPFIDWYYTAQALKTGGLLLIDNVELWTGDVLTQFLLSEPEWKLDRIIAEGAKTAIFYKTAPYSFKEWCWQPFVVKNSDLSELAKAMDITAFPGALEWLDKNPRVAINLLQARVDQLQARLDEQEKRSTAP